MKEIGYWIGQGRLLCTSLSFAPKLESLASQVSLVGASPSAAMQHVRVEVVSELGGALDPNTALGPSDATAAEAVTASEAEPRIRDAMRLCVGEDAQPLVKELVYAMGALRDDVRACTVAGKDLVAQLAPQSAEANQGQWLRGLLLVVDSLLRSSHTSVLHATVRKPHSRTPEPFDVVFLNPTWMGRNQIGQDAHATVLNVRTGSAIEVRLRSDAAPQESDGPYVRVSSHVSMRLGFRAGDGLVLSCHGEIEFGGVMMQQLESIGERKVLVGDNDLMQINPRYAYHQITCPATGFSLVVPTTSFCRGPQKNPGAEVPHSIRLSRQQRALLGLHAPYLLSDLWIERMASPATRPKAKEVIDAHYTNGKLNEALDYESATAVWKALKGEGYGAVRISPLADAPKGAPRIHQGRPVGKSQQVLERLCNKYLGQASSIHRVGRPYDVDEDRRIVRLTSDVMSLLGIEVMDQVVISYGLRSVSVRVMAIDNDQKIAQMNAMSETENLDVIVGMPALLRSELCLDGIGMSVEIRRDTRYLFAKTINQQFIPALGLFLTVLSIFPPADSPLWVPLGIFLALLPFVAYSVLSDERSKVVDNK